MKFHFIYLFLILFFQGYDGDAWTLKDSSRVLSLNKEAFELVYNNPGLARQKVMQALSISRSIQYGFGEAQAYSRMGIVLDVEGKYDSALYYYERAYAVYKKSGHKKGQGATLCNIGLLHLNRNNYGEALRNLHAAVKPLEEVKEYLFLGNCYNNIGLLYYELDNFQKAAGNYQLAIEYYDRVNNVYQKANAISNLSNLYSDIGKNDSSILLGNIAIRIYEEQEDYYNLGKNYNNLAILYDETGRFDEAEKAFLLSVKYADKSGNSQGLADTYINLATFYTARNNLSKSRYYTSEAYRLSENIESPKLKADIYYYYALICIKTGNHKLANELLLQSKQLRDSIFKYEIAEKIAIQEARFGMEKKENENKQLKQKNRIQELEILNKKNELQSRQIITYGIVGFGVLIVFLGFMYLKRRYTIQKLRAENRFREEQQKQRVQISQELHDNVGAQLSYIVSNVGMLQENDRENQRLKSISDMSKQSIVTLRETVWALNNESISLTGFKDKFNQFIIKMMESKPGITYNLQVDIQTDHILQPLHALNLFRISQEAFSNAVHHSQASRISFRISGNDEFIFQIEIADNGIGFDQEEALLKGHYGLHTMRNRSDEMGAEFKILSTRNLGSTVEIKLRNT